MNLTLPDMSSFQVRLRSLEPRQLRLAGLGLVGLLFVGLLAYLVVPEWRQYRGSASTLQLLKTGLAGTTDLDSQLAALRKQVDDLGHTLHGDASNLPPNQMEAFVIGRLQTISWRNSLVLVRVEPREGEPVADFRELIFDVVLQGSYADFYAWLGEIGAELGFIVVKSFEIKDAGQQPADGVNRLEVNLTVAAYRSTT